MKIASGVFKLQSGHDSLQTDRQTDRQTDARGKTMSPNPSGGDIITGFDYLNLKIQSILAILNFYEQLKFHAQLS